MKKTVLVTGATSGFGEAIAHEFGKNGFRTIITGRRQERLAQVSKDLVERGVEVFQLEFDVRSHSAVEKAIASLPEDWRTIDILVNNAGLALSKTNIADGDSQDWDQMIDTNVKGLLYTTKAVVRLMQSGGHIINIGSIAGKEVYSGGNVYCASKHAVDALTKAMRLELAPDGIRVTQIAPGAAETEFSLVRFKGDPEKAKNVYQGFQPLSAQDIAETAYFAASRPAHVCLNDIVIMPTAQPNSTTLVKK